jgi:hypothetical protein
MKIAIPKQPTAPSTVERPQLSTPAKSGNTGIVPPAQTKPADSFQPAKPTGTGSTSGNTGIVPPNLQKPTGTGGTAPTTGTKPTSVSTYALAPALEPHRATFDRVGSRIAKLPAHIQEAAILRATNRLSKKYADIATPDQVGKGVREAVAYAGRSTTTEEPMSYVMRSADGAVNTAKDVGSLVGRVTDYGRQITRDPSQLNAGNILRSVRQPPQEQQADETRQLFRRMPRWF